MSSKGPKFLTWSNCSKKSSNVNDDSLIFFSKSLAFSWSTSCCAFSMRLKTSPIPKIREAIRSGWNNSKPSNFSLIPTNLIGFWVTERIESAAPPRVSPSNLVNVTPETSNCSSNDCATFTASWPVIASTTSIISSGLEISLTSWSSFISASSMCKRPAVSMITKSRCSSLACFKAFSTICCGDTWSPSLYTGISICLPTVCNWSIAAGR